MKRGYRPAVAIRQKSKKQKKVVKPVSLASIAQRYLEVQRLRERVSQVESWQVGR